ncbi:MULTISPECIES: response regulator [unclassified Sphingobacterium]|jgi:DNA-binding NarL/FixJ family response regulator|uniref:response regulator n=1 Tax=unclassified Sphingobacterium TaxID=2609468 RepID=UPI0021D213D9|nr:response regulator [Sphingobacterium sp. B16(2022)]
MRNHPIKLAFTDDSIFQQNMIQLLIERDTVFDLFFICGDGLDLIKRLEFEDELPEVCIIDFHMPNMGGVAAAIEISARFPSIKLFGYTATTDFCEIKEFKRNGGVHVFPKTNPTSMLEKINSWTYNDDLCQV